MPPRATHMHIAPSPDHGNPPPPALLDHNVSPLDAHVYQGLAWLVGFVTADARHLVVMVRWFRDGLAAPE